jgi:hypothetical protein
MDSGPASERRSTRRRRVSSPRAAKRRAAVLGGEAALARIGDVPFDEGDDHSPASFVGGEGFGATGKRNAIEAGLGYGEQDAGGTFLELEDNESGGLRGIIDPGLDGIGMPAEGEQALLLHAVDCDIERRTLVWLLSLCDLGIDGGRDADAADGGTRREGGIESYTEPSAELGGIGESAPDAVEGRMQEDLFADAIGIHATSWLHDKGRRRRNATVWLRDGTSRENGSGRAMWYIRDKSQ